MSLTRRYNQRVAFALGFLHLGDIIVTTRDTFSEAVGAATVESVQIVVLGREGDMTD